MQQATGSGCLIRRNFASTHALGISLPCFCYGCITTAFAAAAQRQPSAAPLATSTDRHERWCATTPHDRAQVRGRASGVRCKAMLGRRHEPHDMRKNMLNKGDAFSKTGNVKFASLDLVLVPTLLFRYHFERLREFETKISLTILFQNHILLAPKYFQIRSL